ncbi:hypothetical protein B0H17DRAFT_1070306 [Mycena rosella]|uniref:Uncharacterized protein n=1 Tax=Mycena rosella TaxID=1033263 RepID=A0AAD7DBL4_MYCRO|nr:hypothetical protein B0H17DRAFT_1070306 [Mycena rosella]
MDTLFLAKYALTLEAATAVIENQIQDLENNNDSLTFARETITPLDLRRFLRGGLANDELINIYVAALNFTVLKQDSASEISMGSSFGLPPPARDFYIGTTFFYRKMVQCGNEGDALNKSRKRDATELAVIPTAQIILKWFKNVHVGLSYLTPYKNIIPETDLVESLFGDRVVRRAIRLGKYMHAHEVLVQDDVLENFRNVLYTPEIDAVLTPHLDLLSAILRGPEGDYTHIPSVRYLVLANKTSLPFAGDLSLLQQTQLMNWFHDKIPQARDMASHWVGSPAHAHTITIFIANRDQTLLRSTPKFPAAQSDNMMAVPIVNTDVDLECLSLLEEWMFECTDKAGIAGDEQWGLDAGHHQDCWVPYEGTPKSWSSYRDDAQDETIYHVSFSPIFENIF